MQSLCTDNRLPPRQCTCCQNHTSCVADHHLQVRLLDPRLTSVCPNVEIKKCDLSPLVGSALSQIMHYL